MFKSSEDKKGFLFISWLLDFGLEFLEVNRIPVNSEMTGMQAKIQVHQKIHLYHLYRGIVDDIRYFYTVENQGHNYQVKRQRILNRIIRFFCARHLETGLGFPKTVSCTAENKVVWRRHFTHIIFL